MKILLAVSELAGIVKNGGLADVASALAFWMKKLGHDVRVVMPGYREALDSLTTDVVGVGEVIVSPWFRTGYAIREGDFQGIPVYFIEHSHYFDRAGLYTVDGEGFGDNAERFAFFCRAALPVCEMVDFQPDVIHGHDWQSGLLSFYLKVHEGSNPFFFNTRSVMTIHNGAYQQSIDGFMMGKLGIDPQYFTPDYFKEGNRINLLKGGIAFSDKITTVSPGYAKELLTEKGSHGLSHILQRRQQDFSGILNGCDYEHWDPATDALLPATYSIDNLEGKSICKRTLQESLRLRVDSEVPIYGMVSRLSEQKGFAYLVPVLWEFLQKDIQVVLQGSGDQAVAKELDHLSRVFPDKCKFIEAYDNRLAHLIEAGSDFFLMPSLFEPCGLNQLYSMRYGTLPIVRAVGGLADTVTGFMDGNMEATGFMFGSAAPSALLNSLNQTEVVYRDQEIMDRLIANAMSTSFSWEHSAREYLTVYTSIE
ncbi:glycogen synthase [Endozoicomonas ascidiicola]|uniref:glycogen synthase n=1 Tax=Endozoicomonas ascidiicola TaxID=1698521 RepID=UPI00082EA111|nr:glycogen/starch synthase [Endozoicomonas ascidiicola]